MMKTFALAAVTLGLAVTATPAFAGPQETESRSVSLAGLDLSTAEGQEILDKRIDAAARSICKVDQVRTGTRTKSLSAISCYNKAMASAKQQVAVAVADQQRGG